MKGKKGVGRSLLGVLLCVLGFSAFGFAAIVPLEWDPNSESDVIGYHVYRSDRAGSGYLRLNEGLVIATTFDDASVEDAQTYYYVVTAVNVDGLESDYSNELEVATEANEPPLAGNDQASTAEDTTLLIDVLANDSDPEGTQLTLTETTDGSFGETFLLTDRIRYVPLRDFHGADSFTYTVRDAAGELATASVSVTVTPVNDEPVSREDSFLTQEDVSLTIDVLANDSDTESDSMTVSWLAPPENGSLEELPDGRMIYWPARDFHGFDSFRYRASDGDLEGRLTRVDLQVTPVNDAPQVEAGTDQTVRSGETVQLEGLAADIEDDELTFQWSHVSGPIVELPEPESIAGNFVAPEVGIADTLVLKLTVDDGEASVTDTLSILVKPETETRSIIVPTGLSAESTGREGMFVGTALLNSGLVPNAIRLKKNDDEGHSMGVETLSTLQPGEQQTFADHELTTSEDVSSLVFQGANGELDGFFMIGTSGLDVLDGVAGGLEEGRRLYFPVARQSDQLKTTLFIFNATSTATDVELSLRAPDGQLIASRTFALSENGTLSGNVEQLFGQAEVEEGYVAARGEGPIRGFELFSDGRNLAAFAALAPIVARELLVPHFFFDPGQGNTEIQLLNSGDQTAHLAIEAWSDDGESLAEATLRLDPRQLIVMAISDLLALPDRAVTGHLRITVADDRNFAAPVLGTVSFSGNQGRFLAALPIQRKGLQEQRFLYVAQSMERRIYTGLALLNPTDSPVYVEIEVFDETGRQSGFEWLELAPRTRRVHLLSDAEVFGADFSQVGGHIDVRGAAPIVAFALFGDYDGEFLSAIAGQEVKQHR